MDTCGGVKKNLNSDFVGSRMRKHPSPLELQSTMQLNGATSGVFEYSTISKMNMTRGPAVNQQEQGTQ